MEKIEKNFISGTVATVGNALFFFEANTLVPGTGPHTVPTSVPLGKDSNLERIEPKGYQVTFFFKRRLPITWPAGSDAEAIADYLISELGLDT